MACYAEVILPLPIKGTFTYIVPDELAAEIEHGSRVYVPFGRRKNYTGIVVRLHSEAPFGYEVKPIISLLDSEPIIRYPQIKFWQWLADYYLCTVGDVYKAAIPAGLKIESETYITINRDSEIDPLELPEKEYRIISALEQKSRMSVSEVEKAIHSSSPIAPLVYKMMHKGIIDAAEDATTHYRPKMETFVRLAGNLRDNDWLHEAFDKVSRSVKQEKTLIALLDLLHKTAEEEVLRSDLLNKSATTYPIVKALADKGIVEILKKKVNRYEGEGSTSEDIMLSPLSVSQTEALHSIFEQWKSKDVVLMRGVTGSGKTEVYTHIISEAIAKGDQTLFLVPEISLTTQLTDRLRKVFGKRLLVYHSKFSDNERVDIWKRVLTTREPLVILGARSAIFLPFAHLGAIIVDEEHESSFKQHDPAPRYNARDAAILLATFHGAKVLLGSATPSIETYYKATTGKYGLVELQKRFNGAMLPDIGIVDMKEQRHKRLCRGILSQPLQEALASTLKNGKQAIMFQNRRGYAPMVVCNQCGWTPRCINCDVGLVYHKHADHLRCHYCGYLTPLPKVCPVCGQNSVEVYGYGTERIADDLHEAYPEYRVARMDYDTTRNKNSHQEIIEEFARHDTDILIGTQMVSKGLDFDNVQLVGIINADTMMHQPDFRGAERAFNMMVQVAGRAGRRDVKGNVLIQTVDTENPILQHVKSHDYDAFYKYEIEQRREYAYPPFTRVINFYLKHKDERTAADLARIYADELRKVLGARVLGPVPPSIGRISTYYYQTIMIKVETEASMKKVKQILIQIYEYMARDSRMKTAQVYYDVDPS